MSTAKTNPEEQPKKKTAKRVITPKHLYFMPESGMTVKAYNADEAVTRADQSIKKQEEEGDA